MFICICHSPSCSSVQGCTSLTLLWCFKSPFNLWFLVFFPRVSSYHFSMLSATPSLLLPVCLRCGFGFSYLTLCAASSETPSRPSQISNSEGQTMEQISPLPASLYLVLSCPPPSKSPVHQQGPQLSYVRVTNDIITVTPVFGGKTNLGGL